jgi:hypothetical protein
VFPFKNDDYVLKLGKNLFGDAKSARYSGTTDDFLQRVSQFGDQSNIATPLRYAEIPGGAGQYDNAFDATIMRNLDNQPSSPGFGKNATRDAYASALRQVRRMRDKGIALDVDNPMNVRFNTKTGQFDMFDLENVPQLAARNPNEWKAIDLQHGNFPSRSTYKNPVDYGARVRDLLKVRGAGIPGKPNQGRLRFDSNFKAGGPRKFQASGATGRNYLPLNSSVAESTRNDIFVPDFEKLQTAENLQGIREQEELMERLQAPEGEIKPAGRGAPPNAMAFMPPGLQYNQQAAGKYIEENPLSNPVSLTAMGAFEALSLPAFGAGASTSGRNIGRSMRAADAEARHYQQQGRIMKAIDEGVDISEDLIYSSPARARFESKLAHGFWNVSNTPYGEASRLMQARFAPNSRGPLRYPAHGTYRPFPYGWDNALANRQGRANVIEQANRALRE